MTVPRFCNILALFLSVVLFPGCGSGNNNTNAAPAANAANGAVETADSAKTDIEELGLLINVPFKAEDVVWREFPAEKKLVAVMRFSPEDAASIIAEAGRSGSPESVNVTVETWFPSELVAQSDMSGEGTLRALSYKADQFFQEPFTAGRVMRVESSDYFVLELYSK